MSLAQIMILNNSLAQILVYIGIILVSIYGTKIVYWLFEKVFNALSKKTKSNLDDLIVHAIKGPIILGVFQLGFWYGQGVLTLSETANTVYNQIQEILLIANITWLVVRILDSVIAHYISPDTDAGVKMDKTAYPVMKRIVNFFIYVIGLLFIVQALGYQINSLLAGLGIGGLAFAFAAQDILGNMFGGIAVLTSKPFKVGDRILIAGQDGTVKDIGLRTTTLETFDGTDIVLPNKMITNEVLTNITREPMRRIKVTLGVEYGTPTKKMEKAKKILADIIKKNESTDDKSLVNFIAFGGSSLDILLIYWIKDKDNILGAQDEVNFAIKKAFEKEKIEFAFPSQTVYLRKD